MRNEHVTLKCGVGKGLRSDQQLLNDISNLDSHDMQMDIVHAQFLGFSEVYQPILSCILVSLSIILLPSLSSTLGA